ncbi:hypothetical protein BD413DRAFT_226904 [Trametes elegans]|nr:hypothetical protein BD413DRAFT_226904 [Trametes elegans]
MPARGTCVTDRWRRLAQQILTFSRLRVRLSCGHGIGDLWVESAILKALRTGRWSLKGLLEFMDHAHRVHRPFAELALCQPREDTRATEQLTVIVNPRPRYLSPSPHCPRPPSQSPSRHPSSNRASPQTRGTAGFSEDPQQVMPDAWSLLRHPRDVADDV